MDRPSLLPAPLVDALQRLGASLRGRVGADENLELAIGLLNGLPAAAAPVVAGEIADLAGLHHHHPGIVDALVARLRPGPAYSARLRAVPGLEWLFLFHRDGHAREAALDRVQGAVPSAFFASALGYRLNDWAPQVRDAAAAAVARSFAATDSATLAPAALFLLDRGRHWQRWQGEEAALAEALARPNVAERLAEEFIRRPNGPMARILVSALRRPAMDPYLPALARRAAQPAVRAVAVETLVRGKARWPVGFERRWVDKSMGVWTMVPSYAERTIDSAAPAEHFILQGLGDPSIAVRKVALSGVIALGHIPGEAGRLVRALAADSKRGVRERAQFALGRGSGDSSPP